MYSSIALVKASKFGGLLPTTPDINGLDPIFLEPLAGEIPNRNTLSGTVAKQQGFEIGKNYLVKVTERGTDQEFNIIYNWSNLGVVEDPLKLVQMMDQLGKPNVRMIESGKSVQDGTYKRKTNAVVGQFRQRVAEGKIIPAVQTTQIKEVESSRKEPVLKQAS